MMKRVEDDSESENEGEGENEDIKFCKQFFCSVTLASRPLSLKKLAILANLFARFEDEEFIKDLIIRCDFFLIVRQKTTYFVHQSAKNYFSSSKGSHIFQKGQSYEHARIASLCLKLISTELKRNICNLQIFDSLDEVHNSIVNLSLLSRVEYVCVYWVSHIKQIDHRGYNLQNDESVHQFLKTHFLYWLEAMSLIKKMSDEVVAIMNLECILKVNNSFYHHCRKTAEFFD